MSSLFNKDITYLKGVGERRAKLFSKLGITTVGALLQFYPVSYEDWSFCFDIADAPYETDCCVKASVLSEVREIPIKNNMTLYKFDIADETAVINVTIFNNKYAADRIQYGEEYLFYGKVSPSLQGLEMLSPAFESTSNPPPKLRPIYHQTKGLTSRSIENCVKSALLLFPDQPRDNIPENIRMKYSLCSLKEAIFNIHFPLNQDTLNIARKRLVFEEFFLLQLGLMMTKKENSSNHRFKIKKDCSSEFIRLLPFDLTDAQNRAISECISDMKSNKSMNRLIQGDVGCGKTAVAASICYTAKCNHMQSAFMAPTEILAKQHYNSFSSLFYNQSDFRVALLTSSTKASERKLILDELEKGQIDLLIGTHSLLGKAVKFKSLGLVITDEQHRFGVSQRSELYAKGNNPHLLVMSATPIPRTLALMIYGDLDISIIDELPPGRKEVKTLWINSSKLDRAYNFLKQEISQGRQIYVVCPLVEENENISLKAVETYKEELSEREFKQYNVDLIHGKLKAKEKEGIMNRFKAGEIDVLVSTTVIEVGVDVPNASIMMIQNAERFGLSALHQLRGRVGRGKYKSYCILVSDSHSSDTVKRLSAMLKTSDGFKIAEQDLKLRGPGDFFGARQHGLPQLKIANLLLDTTVLKEAQEAAIDILKQDSKLEKTEYKALKASVNMLFSKVNEILN